MKEKVKATVVNTFLSADVNQDFSNVKKIISENLDSDIIVFSEVCLSNFKDEQEKNAIVKELKNISVDNNIIIVIGLDEVVDGKKYNSAYLIEDGNASIYNKVHLVFDEVGDYEAGDSFPVFDTKIGKIGLMICYDAIFPESSRSLRLNGAEIICLLAQWTPHENEYWDFVTRVRAKENWVYLIASDDANEGCGKSLILGPDGKEIVSIEKKEEFSYASAELDGNRLDKLAKTDPSVNWTKRRKPNSYLVDFKD